MSHFYGTAFGGKTEATRTGTKASGMTTFAASHGGAARCILSHDPRSGKDTVRIDLTTWRGMGASETLYEGPVNCCKPKGGLILQMAEVIQMLLNIQELSEVERDVMLYEANKIVEDLLG